MECFREILLDFDEITKGPEKIQPSGIPNLKQRVKEIQNWRLNFGDHVVMGRLSSKKVSARQSFKQFEY
jgi:hypothetical protein